MTVIMSWPARGDGREMTAYNTESRYRAALDALWRRFVADTTYQFIGVKL